MKNTKAIAWTGRVQSYRLQHIPAAALTASLHRQPSKSSACLFIIFSEKWIPSVVSLGTSIWLKTVGTMTGGGEVWVSLAWRSAFIASMSVWTMVSARDGERRAVIASTTGRKMIASDTRPRVRGWVSLTKGSKPSVPVTSCQGAWRAVRGEPWLIFKASKVWWIISPHASKPPEVGLRRYQSPEPMTRREDGSEVELMRAEDLVELR